MKIAGQNVLYIKVLLKEYCMEDPDTFSAAAHGERRSHATVLECSFSSESEHVSEGWYIPIVRKLCPPRLCACAPSGACADTAKEACCAVLGGRGCRGWWKAPVSRCDWWEEMSFRLSLARRCEVGEVRVDGVVVVVAKEAQAQESWSRGTY